MADAPAAAPAANAAPEGTAPAHPEGTPPAAENPTPPPFDPAKAGLVYRAEGGWGREIVADGEKVFIPIESDETWQGWSATKAAQRKMSNADRIQKESEQVVNGLQRALTQKDPRARAHAIESILQGLEVDVAETVQAWIDEATERAKLSPEARRLADLEAKAEWEQKERLRLENEQKQRELSARQQQYIQQTEAALNKSMTAAGIDQGDPYLRLAMIARIEAVASKTGRLPDFAEVAKFVRDSHRTALPKVLDGVSDDELLSVLGEKHITRILQRKLAAQQAAPKPAAGKPPAPLPKDVAPRGQEPSSKPMTPAQKIAEAKKAGTWQGNGIG